MPFSISTALGILQRVMETILQDISKVVVYLDNILVAGDPKEGHVRLLDEVLSHLENAGLQAQRNKCEFMV